MRLGGRTKKIGKKKEEGIGRKGGKTKKIKKRERRK